MSSKNGLMADALRLYRNLGLPDDQKARCSKEYLRRLRLIEVALMNADNRGANNMKAVMEAECPTK